MTKQRLRILRIEQTNVETFFIREKDVKVMFGTFCSMQIQEGGTYSFLKLKYEQMRKQIEMLMTCVKEVEGMIHTDSHNSHQTATNSGR